MHNKYLFHHDCTAIDIIDTAASQSVAVVICNQKLSRCQNQPGAACLAQYLVDDLFH